MYNYRNDYNSGQSIGRNRVFIVFNDFSTNNNSIYKVLKTIKIKDTEIKLYADIRELPMLRYIEFQKNLLIDSGIGSNMEDVGKHFNSLFQYLNHEKIQDAIRESQNLYRNVYAILNGHNTKVTTLCCLVYSIGGEVCKDITDDGLDATAELLLKTNITWGDIDTQLEEVKKK